VNIEDTFDEETSWSYEAGLKSQWLDDRLRAELAVYHVDVDDMQFFEFVVGGFGLLRVVSNIDEVDIDGVEFSLNYAATDWLSLHAGANFNDTEIKKNEAAGQRGQRVALHPRTTPGMPAPRCSSPCRPITTSWVRWTCRASARPGST
jgi:outer membrane receptor protein involved in Fe transport